MSKSPARNPSDPASSEQIMEAGFPLGKHRLFSRPFPIISDRKSHENNGKSPRPYDANPTLGDRPETNRTYKRFHNQLNPQLSDTFPPTNTP
ncbi:unnamed protein product [Adineta ricciae]|uniref:Uncharacterized protein n=1 Tax=Adineta ricciae TaxID=249248 RepID=A0A814SYR5_ADIRI|nr:unnamed protein product [Adineta ricciae]CAF1568989.1 unnamed protein product [Adineta ricciae]